MTIISTFDTKQAIELYKKGFSYKEIGQKLNVKGSTLRMFYLKKIRQGKIKMREKTVARKKLREIRLQNKLSQQNVADLAGIARSYYTKIENETREPSFRVVKLIKAALNYEGDDLFDVYENKDKI